MQVSKHFTVQELVSEEFYRKWRSKSLWWITPEYLKMIEGAHRIITEEFGPIFITINDWHRGGVFHHSGLRTSDCTEGAADSMHRSVGAADLKVYRKSDRKQIPSWEIFDALIKRTEACLEAGITTLEDKEATRGKYLGWTHIDRRYTGSETELLIVKP